MHRVAAADLSPEPVDVVVIGGGIVGTAIAREAAMRGLATVLVERSDLAAASACPAERLLHGGGQQLERAFGRTLRASRECGVVCSIAPHLVRPTTFVFPIHKHTPVSRWRIASRVSSQAALSLFRNVDRHRLLGKRRVLELEPLIRDRGLLGGVGYRDTGADDIRFTVATARSAARHGATIATYVTAESLDIADGRVMGVRVRDTLAGTTTVVRGAVVVNATGPWLDLIRLLEDRDAEPLQTLQRVAHVQVAQDRLGNRGAVAFASPLDGRLLRVTASGNRSLVGSRATVVDRPDAGEVTRDDEVYLLRSANACFPNARLTRGDVLTRWSTMQPALRSVSSGGPEAGDFRVVVGTRGMISVAGGSFVFHRAMARAVVDRTIESLRHLGWRSGIEATPDEEALPGGEARDFSPLREPGLELGLADSTVDHLLDTFGTEAAAVYNLCRDRRELMDPLHPDHPAILAEVVHIARREMVAEVEDVLARRLRLRWETGDAGCGAAAATARAMGGELGWDGERIRASAEAYRDRATDARSRPVLRSRSPEIP